MFIHFFLSLKETPFREKPKSDIKLHDKLAIVADRNKHINRNLPHTPRRFQHLKLKNYFNETIIIEHD